MITPGTLVITPGTPGTCGSVGISSGTSRTSVKPGIFACGVLGLSTTDSFLVSSGLNFVNGQWLEGSSSSSTVEPLRSIGATSVRFFVSADCNNNQSLAPMDF